VTPPDSIALPARWRPMQPSDFPAVSDLSNRIHVDFPERLQVLEEKFRLFPAGCFTLTNETGAILGYCFSHPWRFGPPPALDSFLEALPANPDTYFIHDMTLDRPMHGKRLASALVPALAEIARQLPVKHMMLVAVSGSSPFWAKMGFRRTADEALQASARAKYDEGAVHMERDLI
jgi:GNAT superfamily N-acetyltransferase